MLTKPFTPFISATNTSYIFTSSPLQDLIELKESIDQKSGITHYKITDSKLMEFHDYWSEKKFKSQPFYILGKILRKTVIKSLQTLSDVNSKVFSFITKQAKRIKNYIEETMDNVENNVTHR